MILVIFCQTALLQNHSQCLLLNIVTNATRDIFQFGRNENTKNEHAHIKKKRKFEEKVIKKDEQFLNIYRPVMNGMQSNLHEPTHTSTSIYLCKLPLHLQNFI